MNEKLRLEKYLEMCENERRELLAKKSTIALRIIQITREINATHKILNPI